jgi:nucleoside 2-deoxyribosyltransferase
VKLIYVAGPFRAKPDPANQWVQWENIRRAAALALDVWGLGAACICPHLNTAFFEGAAPAETWLNGDIEMLKRCDAVLMTEDWQRSSGATAERDIAIEYGIPVFYDIAVLENWLALRDCWEDFLLEADI